MILGVSLSFFGCLSFYHHPEGGFRPKKPRFKLNREKFVDNNLIDTTSIYVNIDTLKYGDYKKVFLIMVDVF